MKNIREGVFILIGIALAIALIFILINKNPAPAPTSALQPCVEEMLSIDDLVRQLDSLNSENQVLAAKVITLESLPNKATHATKIRTVTKVQKEFVVVPDTAALNQLAALKDSTLTLDSLRTLVANYDCNPFYSMSFADTNVALHVEATRDSSSFTLSHTDEIVVQYVKHKKFLRQPEYTVEAYSTSPYSTVSRVQSVKLKESRKSFGVGITFGYDILNNTPSIATGITYTPIKF